MSIKWTIGAVIAVLSGMLVLPGAAVAHHIDLGGSIECADGTWEMHADYSGGDSNSVIFVAFEGDQYDILNDNLANNDAANPANQDEIDRDWGTDDGDGPNTEFGVNTTINHSVELDNNTADDDFNFSPLRDRFEVDGHGGTPDETDHLDSFIAVDGTYQNVDDRPDDQVQLETWLYFANSDSVLDNDLHDNGDFADDGDSSDDWRDYDVFQITTDQFWVECGGEYCVNGDTGVEQLSFQSTATNDCGPVRLCVDGKSQTVTQYDADQIDGATIGSCTPSEPPPPPTSTEPQPETIAEEEAVAEVSPAIEVVALPSAGQGSAAGVSYTWAAIFGLAVVGLGGATALMARPRK